MEPDPDELAGVADLFGGLTRAEFHRAFADLAARSGEPYEAEELDESIDDAVDRYYLVVVEDLEPDGWNGEGTRNVADVLVAGPAALPTLPEEGDALPHLLDVEPRTIDAEAVGTAALTQLRGDAARAVAAGDDRRIARLLDVCYDLEAWAPIETAALRDRLDQEL